MVLDSLQMMYSVDVALLFFQASDYTLLTL